MAAFFLYIFTGIHNLRSNKTSNMFKPDDIRQMEGKGIDPAKLEEQIEWFRKGFPYLPVIRPATINDGIKRLDIDEIDTFGKFYDKRIAEYSALKFVPASGAATRMFKDLYEMIDLLKGNDSQPTNPAIGAMQEFFPKIKEFAFYDDLAFAAQSRGKDLQELISNGSFREVLEFLLNEEGLNYGNLPKGLLKFHKYDQEVRTALEEHLIEGAQYCRGKNHSVQMHLTVSPEHKNGFLELIDRVKDHYEKQFGTKFIIHFSQQEPSTDTLAVDLDNKPFRNADGSLLFRPGGHGALIDNLDSIHAELVFIKNIDNVVPDRIKDATVFYKRAIAGYLLFLRDKIFEYIRLIDAGQLAGKMGELEEFVMTELCIKPHDGYSSLDHDDKIQWLRKKLDRPLRICGMVKNVGEPGGGPFWAKNPDGSESLQIVESSQINKEDPEVQKMITSSTHFNPVDLVCSVRDHNGQKYSLKRYIDPATGFISFKTHEGKALKAQELPGLWNGAMSDWITIFMEVPLITFNPVKTVFDLLRPEHKG
jgi:hypothetical protein